MGSPYTMRLGIFGGSFDPVHYGHLLLAESCREQCRLDRVWLLPAAAAPHKRERRAASARQRIEMLRLAVGGHQEIEVSTLEIDRGGVSYTVETLESVHRAEPTTEIFLLMGADTLIDLPNWRAPARICELAVPVAVARTGSPAPNYDVLAQLVNEDRLNYFRQFAVIMPIVELASTDLRARVAAGQSIRYRTPRAVEKYIETNNLYR